MSKFDRVLMANAVDWAQESHCKRLQVGAIISLDGRVVSTGFNGMPNGSEDNCCEVDKATLPALTSTRFEVVHAEMNAILFAARVGRATEGATLHITHSPCEACTAAIIQSGIIRVVYGVEYRNSNGIDILMRHGIVVEQYTVAK